jgi:uncharacterized protein (DUF983 family)
VRFLTPWLHFMCHVSCARLLLLLLLLAVVGWAAARQWRQQNGCVAVL